MDREERRNNTRIPQEQLPEELKRINVTLNEEQKVIGEVLDLSRTGIAILVPLSKNSIRDYDITLTTMDNAVTLIDELVYVKFINKDVSRISIMFSKKNSDKISQLFNTYFH